MSSSDIIVGVIGTAAALLVSLEFHFGWAGTIGFVLLIWVMMP